MAEQISDLAAQIMREHFARMKSIDDKAVNLTTGLGVFNARQIFLLGNAKAHPDARLPAEEINALTDLVSGKEPSSNDNA